MAENRQISQKNEDDGDAAQIYQHLKSLEPDELIDELAEKLDAMDDMTFDPELIDQYLAVLEENKPLDLEFDTNSSLTDFHEKHAMIFQQSPTKKQVTRPRRRFIARLAYVAALVALGSIIAAQAFGVDVFGAVAKWTQETFHFGIAATQESNAGKATGPIEYGIFAPLREAVDDSGITELIVPSWCPDGFVPIEEPEVTITSGISTIYYPFQNESLFFMISIQQYKTVEDATAMLFEKDDQDITIYEVNGIMHYMVHNLAQVQAIWLNGTVIVSISGNLSVNELETMINSIYGG